MGWEACCTAREVPLHFGGVALTDNRAVLDRFRRIGRLMQPHDHRRVVRCRLRVAVVRRHRFGATVAVAVVRRIRRLLRRPVEVRRVLLTRRVVERAGERERRARDVPGQRLAARRPLSGQRRRGRRRRGRRRRGRRRRGRRRRGRRLVAGRRGGGHGGEARDRDRRQNPREKRRASPIAGLPAFGTRYRQVAR